METLILLIPLSLVLVFVAGAGYLWMHAGGQFDDLDAAGSSIIADDDRIHAQVDINQKIAHPDHSKSEGFGPKRGFK